MLIDTVITGRETGLFENCYIVRADDSSDAVVIDPGDGYDAILRQIEKQGLTVSYILLTHGHADHIAAAAELKEKYGAKIAVHKLDALMLTDPMKNLSQFMGRAVNVGKPDILLEDGNIMDAAGLSFAVKHTPGHTPGGCCFIVEAENIIFSGDTLFAGSMGRVDFPGSSEPDMLRSLKALAELPGDYRVLSGHGQETTLDAERRFNPYMRG
ncbi:MAG: MBL fold metallo-hydrolase [Christensenella sp.]|nr:MBL fold metallo-hydrolase [Christensenella sp.]